MDWFVRALQKYTVLNGRAQRAEYWYFTLFYFLIFIALIILDVITGLYDEESGYGLFSTIAMLALLVPSITVGVRRLHDTGRSGWWLLISLIPLAGALVLLYFLVLDSHPGENQYGPNPKGITAD